MQDSSRGRSASLFTRFESRGPLSELVSVGIRSLFIRLLGVSTGFLVTWFTAASFGTEALGIVSICIGILSITSVFARLGFDVALLRFISGFHSSGDSESIRGIYRMAIAQVVGFSLLCGVVLFLAAPWMAEYFLGKPYLTGLLQLNAFMIVPLAILQVNAECLRGTKRIGSYTFFQTAAISTFALVGLLLVSRVGHEKEWPLHIQFVSISLAALISSALWANSIRLFSGRKRSNVTAQELRSTAAPMLTSTFMQLLMTWSGTLILAAYVNESTVGVYNALVRIAVFTTITVLAVSGVVMPRFATAFSTGDWHALKRNSVMATRLMLITALPLFVMLLLFSTFVLHLFGAGFTGTEDALYVLLGGQFIAVISGLPSQLLNMTGRQTIMRNIAIVSAVINVTCCFIFIPRWGMMGACYAQLIGTLCWNLSSVAAVYSRYGFLTCDFWSSGTSGADAPVQ